MPLSDIAKVRSTKPTAPARLGFIDNLRWSMIVLVVIMHAAVTYSNLGSWYYIEPPRPGPLPLMVFACFQTHLQAFFMGLLFLVAGYFVPGSCDRKGPSRFLAERAFRLGLPTALFVLFIHPFTVYGLLELSRGRPPVPLLRAYGHYLGQLRFLSGTGPLWFALALLIFCGIYALGRLALANGRRAANGPAASDGAEDSPFPAQDSGITSRLPSHRAVVQLILLIGVLSFLIRVVQPIGTSVLNMQLCFFPQYVILFGLGLVAYRRNWLVRLPAGLGWFWLRAGLIGGPLLWLAMMLGGGALTRGFEPYTGGWHWQSAAYAGWEAFFGVAMCLGLVVLFRERFTSQDKLARFLSENAFAVYVLHTPVLVAWSMALHGVALPALVKCLLLSGLGLATSFLLAHFAARKIPGLRQVLA